MTKNRPDVSVIVTSYNNSQDIEACLECLFNQTLKNIEIVCVDDASTDDSVEILKKIKKANKRMKLIVNPENVGLAAARNVGMKAASAPYIMFCDGDDYYETDACEEMLKAITKHDAGLAINEINTIYHAHQEMEASDREYYRLKYTNLQTLDDDVIYNTDLSSTNKIFRKSILDEYKITFPEGLRFEDAYFCVMYMCVCKNAFYLNKRLYNYVRRSDSIMSQTWSKQNHEDHAIDHLYIAFRLYDALKSAGLLTARSNLYWRFFEAFEAFAINNSKTRRNANLVRTKAAHFIKEHSEDFIRADLEICARINHLTFSGKLISVVKVKKFILKFLPSYKLAIDNIHTLQSVVRKQQDVIDNLPLAISKIEKEHDE